MFRGFSAELSCPRAQHNVRRPYTRVGVCVAVLYANYMHSSHALPRARVSHTRMSRTSRHGTRTCANGGAESASGNVYITCAVAARHTRLQMPV